MRNGQSTFSAIDCIQNLKKVGFTPEQAEAQAKEIERSRIDLMTVLATKQDIELIKKDIEAMGNKMVIWLGGIVATLFLAGLGIIFTMAKLGVFLPSQN